MAEQESEAQIQHVEIVEGSNNDVIENGLLVAINIEGFYKVAGKRSISREEVATYQDTIESRSLDEEVYSLSYSKIGASYTSTIASKIASMRHYLKENSLPFSLRDNYIPVTRASEILGALREYADEITELWLEFVNTKYDRAVEEAREKLKRHFNQKGYPTKEELRDNFRVVISTATMATPGVLKRFDEAEFKKQQDALLDQVKSFKQDASDMLRVQFDRAIRELTRLLTKEEGADKYPQLHETRIGKFNALIKNIQALDFVAEDTPLKSVVERTKQILTANSVDIEDAKTFKPTQTREALASAFTSMLNDMEDSLEIKKVARRLNIRK